MTNKAYIVANEQQEHEVLEKFEREGMVWSDGDKLTKWTPSQNGFFDDFPYALTVINDKVFIATSWLTNEIVFDGRKEEHMSEKYVVSKEFMYGLEEWRKNKNLINELVWYTDIKSIPEVVKEWWAEDFVDKKKTNNRLIAILRWVNGEDVFEVEKPKKWVVRSKELNANGGCHYGVLAHFGDIAEMNYFSYYADNATKFDTKEEAQSWANGHQEVIEVEE